MGAENQKQGQCSDHNLNAQQLTYHKKNIIATLNLTKSLDNFEQTVTKFLELFEVEKWDGNTDRELEEKM